MLAALCARSKPLKTPLAVAFLSSFCAHGSALHHHQYGRFVPVASASASSAAPAVRFSPDDLRRRHTASCSLGAPHCGGAASIWHAILPSPTDHRRPAIQSELLRGEGSWNAALDARPARWLHRADSEWLLFGVCACLSPPPPPPPPPPIPAVDCRTEAIAEPPDLSSVEIPVSDDANIDDSADYRVTGVLADGRCLFRAIAHVACLRNGDEAPGENRQRELADELRAQVVNELLKRREESEWFIEGDFDAYVKNIQRPYVWGGEPELLMASHVLKTPIWVYMRERSTGELANIAKYGEEYGKNEENCPINVLFHGYGHYDILETTPSPNKTKA